MVAYSMLKPSFGIKGVPTQAPDEGFYANGLCVESAQWD